MDKLVSSVQDKGYFCIPNFVNENEIERINKFFDSKRDNFVAAKIGKGNEAQRSEDIRGDFSLWIDPLEPPEELKSFMNVLENLKNELNRNLYLGLKQYECHFAYYPQGTFYKKHLDKFQLDSTRVFTFILYLNQRWETSFGGELVIYDKHHKMIERIEPHAGSFVGFISEEFPHEVLKSNKERRSFTGWMHSKIIY